MTRASSSIDATLALLIAAVLCGCGELIGASDIEYTLDADGGTSAPGVSGNCAGTAGPTPVDIEGKFCIDSTEVTFAQYLDFLAAAPSEQAPKCEWNVTAEGLPDFEPAETWPRPDPRLAFPVGAVDWCDAWAYCHWAGKRLCAGVAGAVLDEGNYDTTDNELFYACSHGGENQFPYGPLFDPDACVTSDSSGPLPVQSLASCEGGYPGIFDLSGNMAEWQDTCAAVYDDPRDDECRFGAGAYAPTHITKTAEYWSCATDHAATDDTVPDRDSHWPELGIRCCSDTL
jgi:formylglycine-generating enzyme